MDDKDKDEECLQRYWWVVTYVEYGDCVDGRARVLGLYRDSMKASEEMAAAARQYLADLELDPNSLKFGDRTADVGDDECGCFYRMDRVEIPGDPLADIIERVVRDAIVSYQEMYPTAPNDDTEREMVKRAHAANRWLRIHGFKQEKVFWDKEEQPCL